MDGGNLWISLTVLLGTVLILVVKFRKRWWYLSSTEAMKWPSGPSKLPIIGNLHQLNKGGELVHVTLAKMAREHGKMMTVWFGGRQPSIVVSHHEVAWEVLVSKSADYSSRTLPFMSKITSADWHTLATSNLSPFWQTLRKGLQTSALTPQTISAQIQLQEEDIKNMILSFRGEASLNNGVVKPLLLLRRTTIQLIGRFCFGIEFNKDENGFVEAMNVVVEDAIRLSGHARIVYIFEFTRYIPGFRFLFKEAYEVKKRIENIIRPYIDLYRSSTNCFLHFLLSQDYTEEVIIFNLYELFLLAVDSTSMATSWALAFLIHNRDIQEKVYKEIREIGQKSEIVTVEEVGKLKYVNAVVKETTRMKPIAPLAVPHKAVRDSSLMGIKVNKNTPVLVNIYAMHYDPGIWTDPSKFMPERFLDEDHGGGGGGMSAMERSWIPFGAGRRICAGMEVAKIQVALTLANLVNSFEWNNVREGELPDLTEDLTFILRMKTQLVARIVPRSS
uniref:Putative cytochrome P450 n=1 Tax=Eschscholzia californica subsp. californica TaxID=222997 RepID=A0A2Z6BXX8_ESCCA|nr:putative cytochrome P450 [Eschscholzia californica subsp. californica]